MSFVYVLEMARWADNNNHSYCNGAFTTLAKTLDAGLAQAAWRSRKYEPTVYMLELDGPCRNILCRSEQEALHLYKELTGQEWKEKEEEPAE